MGDVIRVDFGRNNGVEGQNHDVAPPVPETLAPSDFEAGTLLKDAIRSRVNLIRASLPYIDDPRSHETYGELLQAADAAHDLLDSGQRKFVDAAIDEFREQEMN